MCRLWAQAFDPLQLSTMSRPDPLKIFIGSLDATVNKPMIEALMDSKGLLPAEIQVPEARKGKMAVAFATFATLEQSQDAVALLHGHVDHKLSPNCVKAVHVWPEDTSLESSSVHLAKTLIVWALRFC